MPSVLWETRGAVTRLRLNRPESLNALDAATAKEFKAAVKRIARERSRVVILTGAGSAFCAGGDLGFIEGNTRRRKEELYPLMRGFYQSFLDIQKLPQVTIAQINGAAVGAGLCLALACDLRAATAEAKLAFNFVRLGLNPGLAAWPLALRAFGDAKARELLFTGRFFTGQDLHAWGAASVAAKTAEALEGHASALALEIAAHSSVALRHLKTETRLSSRLEPFLKLEARGQAEAFKSPDIVEGVAAIKERRPPRFQV